MDYLTILTTRSLLLFAPPAFSSKSTSNPDGLPPITPTSILPTPPPIAIPLSNLLSTDSRLFFFLQQHVLARPEHLTTRDERADAEVMVWRELAKAGTFIRELGMAAGRGEVKEAGLKKTARRCGLILISLAGEEKGQRIKRGGGETAGTGLAGSLEGRDVVQGEKVAD